MMHKTQFCRSPRRCTRSPGLPQVRALYFSLLLLLLVIFKTAEGKKEVIQKAERRSAPVR